MPWVNSRANGSRRSVGRDAEVGQRLGEEAGVHQVEDGVLDAADVLVDRHPPLDRRPGRTARPRSTGRRSAGSTRTSRRRCPWCRSRGPPGRRRSGTSCAGSPRGSLQRRLARGQELDVVGRERPAAGRRARARRRGRGSRRSGSGSPRTAGGDSSQSRRRKLTLRSPMPCSSSHSMALALASATPRPSSHSLLMAGPVAHVRLAVEVVGRLDGADDRQAVGLGEVPVALVLAGHGHDRPGAVGRPARSRRGRSARGSPVNGLTAYGARWRRPASSSAPSDDSRSISLVLRAWSTNASTSARCSSVGDRRRRAGARAPARRRSCRSWCRAGW